MKKNMFCLLSAFLFALTFFPVAPVTAAPVGNGNHAGDYIVSDLDLSRWIVGLNYLDRERYVHTVGQRQTFETTKINGYVAYEWLYGILPFFALGTTDTRLAYNGDSQLEPAIGVFFNIFDHEVPDPTLLEDKIRINGSLQYSRSSVDTVYSSTVKWDELYASLTLSLVNDVEGNKFIHMESIAFFMGFVYSDIMSSGINEDDSLGYTFGVNVFITENVSLEAGYESIDNGSLMGSINIWM